MFKYMEHVVTENLSVKQFSAAVFLLILLEKHKMWNWEEKQVGFGSDGGVKSWSVNKAQGENTLAGEHPMPCSQSTASSLWHHQGPWLNEENQWCDPWPLQAVPLLQSLEGTESCGRSTTVESVETNQPGRNTMAATHF